MVQAEYVGEVMMTQGYDPYRCSDREELPPFIDTRFVNRNWLLKVSGNGVHSLVGVTGLVDLVGVSLASKFVSKATLSKDDRIVF